MQFLQLSKKSTAEAPEFYPSVSKKPCEKSSKQKTRIFHPKFLWTRWMNTSKILHKSFSTNFRFFSLKLRNSQKLKIAFQKKAFLSQKVPLDTRDAIPTTLRTFSLPKVQKILFRLEEKQETKNIFEKNFFLKNFVWTRTIQYR